MKSIFTSLLLFLSSFAAFSQALPRDTLKLDEVTVKGYYNKQPILRSVSAVSLVDSNLIRNQQNSSLVSIFNTVPGVRMEERSPGSYRLSLRGSLLRSPFGIRNIKIYVDNFPLTDAGGNTYLNALDVTAVGSLEIYKGPEASIFGANTGGAILISTADLNQNKVEVSATAGSYGLFHQTANVQQNFKNYRFNFTEGYQKSNGYRENSALSRKYFQTIHQWDYNKSGTLEAFIFYSDLDYETPGGLTEVQAGENPKLARPATSKTPGAITQQAAIYNKTIFGGLSNTYQINSKFKHVISLFTSYTDFKNPFITNYEKRYESTLGLRTFLEFAETGKLINWTAQAGLESSGTKSQIKNYDNNSGTPAAMQAFDHLKANQDFAFIRLNFDLERKLLVELSSSLNFFNYKYESFYPLITAQKQRKFTGQFMPKIAVSYLINNELSARVSVGKGYSPPTTAEVRPSGNLINNDLQAESGWNYETGLRFKTINNRFYANVNLFQYRLKDAIVRRLRDNDAEYFINAGGTKQQGIELETSFCIVQNRKGFLNNLYLRNGYTYSHFRFQDFITGITNFNGNKLTGVPEHTLVNSLEFQFNKGLYFFAQHNYTSAIPLNDANTTFSNRYHLVEVKTGIRSLEIKNTHLDIFAGVNNLLNEKYSLGNDLNAANERYFNPAAGINFYSGISIKL
ncbi:TonB-dependent receptor [Pedobacter punctiformis]|uniref:TonB-dependent receptor n=1 Tax=Pedobacter punctiformis TaxID=3004097 RepID=A0ABT4L9M7_9SPHI|nr:TonB-dependent receptor [Pedobacter sp. HCMS5-2]MCZ4244629.1 TonB-dependent receptor [Pedobacter sp. HCMS5-2]